MISCTSGWRTTSRSVKVMKRMPGMPRRMAAASLSPDALPAGRSIRFRAVAEAGEEHLHLLGGRVLGLVEDDEGVVQRVVREEEVIRDVEGVWGGDADADALLGPRRLDGFDESHRAAPAHRGIFFRFAAEPERYDAGWQTDVHDVRVGPIGDVPAVGPPRLPTRRRARAPVRDSTERPHEEDYVVPELRGGSAELYPATSTVLHYGSSVRVQESLEDC